MGPKAPLSLAWGVRNDCIPGVQVLHRPLQSSSSDPLIEFRGQLATALIAEDAMTAADAADQPSKLKQRESDHYVVPNPPRVVAK